MAKFVIDKKVLEADERYYGSLLMPIANVRNGHTIAFNQKIKEEYLTVKKTTRLDAWLEIATATDVFKNVECAGDPIFIKTCLETYDKKLIVSEKEDYSDYEGLTPIDKDEAMNQIRPANIIIIQTGDNAQATCGSGSNITN